MPVSRQKVGQNGVRPRAQDRPLPLAVVCGLSHRKVRRFERRSQHGPGVRIRVDQQDGLALVPQADVHVGAEA